MSIKISRAGISNVSRFQGKRLNGLSCADGRDDVSVYVICICEMHITAPPRGHRGLL